MCSVCHARRVAWLCAVLACTAAAEQPRLIAPLDSDEGVKLRAWSSNVKAELKIITDAALVSQGDASLCIDAHSGDPIPGRSGSQYVSVTITVKPLSMRERMLMIDVTSRTPKHTRAFYMRLRDSKGREIGSWSSWSLRAEIGKLKTIRFQQGSNLDGMRYEKTRVEAPDAPVKTIEIITGTRDPNVPFDLILDNVRLGEAMLGSLEKLKAPRKLLRKTILRGPVLVVAPESAKILPMVAKLKALGSEVALAAAGTAPDWGTTTILLGNVNTNPAIFPLYAHGYCFADRAFPGEGGYELRSIHDPFGSGANVVLIGASDDVGLARGIEAFVKKLTPELVLDPIIEMELTGEAKRALASYFTPMTDRQIAARVREFYGESRQRRK